MIKLEDGMWNKIWVPDVFFRNEKRADFHSVTVPQRLLRLYSDGRLWYVSKITAKLSCPMKLKKYPLDTQKCPFIFESFGHTLERVVYKWLPNSVEKEPFEMPQYQLIGWTQRDCSQNYTAGAFPCLQIDFLLKRDIGFYMIQVYIPSILIVILSWVSFWIDIDAVPARVPLGLLTVLTMTTQSAGANSHLPRVSYIKAIDVWMCMCLLFVFASLLEFALVNVYSRKEFNIWRRTNSMMPVQNGRKHHHHHHHRHGSDGAEEEIPLKKVVTTPSGISLHMNGKSDYASLREDEKRFLIEHKQKARHIDKISRKIFPVSFILFNVVYWVTYFMLPDD
ncbi:glycine receptor subunit alpha-2-like [Lingula anatina]|nr:glycine receptor subunit alpha-2-like [Lingula anatina]|eukprot:XP_013386521.1 glycine receptor subunit alpha-2-like [Lingula anatina]